MPTYRTALVSGRKRPYDTWTFVVVPVGILRALGESARIDVRGTIAGAAFRSTISKGEGAFRFPVAREVREAAGVGVGDVVDVVIEVDTKPRPVDLPSELREVLETHDLRARFEELAPSQRRAWAQYVAEAKKSDTRIRRAREAPAGIRARRFPGQRHA
jgi:hypothetical protein